MAVTQYGVNHPLAVKTWSKVLFVEGLKATKFNTFLGTSPRDMIQKKVELQKSAGDAITIGMRAQFASAGVNGDSTLEGNEEALQTYNDKLLVDQLRNASRTGGRMSQQRVPFEIRQESMEGLADWFTDRLDGSFFNQIGGATTTVVGANTAVVPYDIRYTGNNAPIAPTASLLLLGNQGNSGADTTEASLSATTTESFTLQDIDRCVAKAKTLSPMLRPIRTKGGDDKYVMFLHPNTVYQLRKGTAAGQYVDIQKAAMTGGQIEKNPLYTGALGEYNNTILHESARVPPAQAAQAAGNTINGGSTGFNGANTVFRNIFCGAQAAGFAIGGDGRENMVDWVEELFDYGNQLGVAAGLIFGLKKFIYNARDWATIVVSSYAPAP